MKQMNVNSNYRLHLMRCDHSCN